MCMRALMLLLGAAQNMYVRTLLSRLLQAHEGRRGDGALPAGGGRRARHGLLHRRRHAVHAAAGQSLRRRLPARRARQRQLRR